MRLKILGIGLIATITLAACEDTGGLRQEGNSPFAPASAAGEGVYVDGKIVGSTASVAFGHTYGKILAFAYVKPEVYVDGAECEVMIAGKKRKGRFLTEPVYDPASELPRKDVA